MTYSTFLYLMDRVRSFSCAPIFPLQPSHTPPLCCNAGRNATSSPPARLAPSPAGTETRLDTTAKRVNIAPKAPRQSASPSRSNQLEETVKERMSTRNLWFDCYHLVIGQNGRNNGGVPERVVRRKTAFHSPNRRNVRLLADRKSIPANHWRSPQVARLQRRGPPLARYEQRITSQHPGIVRGKMARFRWWIVASD